MKCLTIFFFLVMFLSNAFAQPVLTEKSMPAVPGDVKQNNDSVPDAYAIEGQFERVLVIRMKHQTDILAGLESIVKKEKITNAAILSAIGSVTDYTIHSVGNRTFPTSNIFVQDTTSSADILNLNGYVIGGRIHAHISLSRADKAFGGHLESGTKVFTFAVITLGVFQKGIDLGLVDKANYR